MEMISLYEFDPTGRSPANRIENESITVIPPAEIKDYSYVIPRAAPFYADTMVIRDGKGPGARRLIENVDYWCVIDFLSASHSLQRRVSVGVALLDARYSGTLYATYQAVGGNYSLADYSILEELIRARYVVKHVSYEQIINLPEGFAPEWHRHLVADMVGMDDVVKSMKGIISALQGKEGSLGQNTASLNDHLENADAHSPHNVGLGNLRNYAIATVKDVYDGNAMKYVTADILNYYVSKKLGGDANGVNAVGANAASARVASVNAPQMLSMSYEQEPVTSVTKTTKAVHMSLELDVAWTLRYDSTSGLLSGSATVVNPFVFNPDHPLELKLPSNAQGSPTNLPLTGFNTNYKQGGPYQNFNIYCNEQLFKMKDKSTLTLGLQSPGNVTVTLDALTVYFTASASNSSLNTKVLTFLDGIS